VQVTRLVAGPAELPRPAGRPGPAGAERVGTVTGAAAGDPGPGQTGAGRPSPGAGDPGPGETGAGRPADVSALLDEAFGEEP
jgi:hypothetical protein